MKLKPADIDKIALRSRADVEKYRMRLMICAGTGCVSNKSFEVRDALNNEIAKRKLQDEVQVVPTGCQGFCERGPLVVMHPGKLFSPGASWPPGARNGWR